MLLVGSYAPIVGVGLWLWSALSLAIQVARAAAPVAEARRGLGLSHPARDPALALGRAGPASSGGCPIAAVSRRLCRADRRGSPGAAAWTTASSSGWPSVCGS